jgi:hypothetical protein
MEDYHFGYIMKLKNKHIGWKSKLILMGEVQPSNFGTCYFLLFSFYPPFFSFLLFYKSFFTMARQHHKLPLPFAQKKMKIKLNERTSQGC